MKKFDIFLLAWSSFFAVYEITLMVSVEVTTFRVTSFLVQVGLFTMIFIENKEYLMKKFREYVLKDLQ